MSTKGQKSKLKYGPQDILQMYERIAFSDISAFAEFESVELETGEQKTFVRLKKPSEVDTGVIEEIVISASGVPRVKLYDKFKALEKLERYYDLFPDTWRREFEEKKLALAKKEKSGAVLNVFSNVPRPTDGETNA